MPWPSRNEGTVSRVASRGKWRPEKVPMDLIISCSRYQDPQFATPPNLLSLAGVLGADAGDLVTGLTRAPRIKP
uniref:Yga2B, Corynebacterium glutamicum LP-6 plasmid pGA2 n=1 Tax=Corynebacterium glutamicum TaxID=1718 RepID=D2KYB2_CORGT|nr:Yga2B, Corynebacterium glutamicum LP-6 plasmid pGA2 [Corynebacterium glutamicum]